MNRINEMKTLMNKIGKPTMGKNSIKKASQSAKNKNGRTKATAVKRKGCGCKRKKK